MGYIGSTEPLLSDRQQTQHRNGCAGPMTEAKLDQESTTHSAARPKLAQCGALWGLTTKEHHRHTGAGDKERSRILSYTRFRQA